MYRGEIFFDFSMYVIWKFFQKNTKKFCDDELPVSLRVPGEYELSTEELWLRVGRRREYEFDELRHGCDYGRTQ